MSKPLALVGKRVLVTGIGIKPVEHVFHDITTDKPSHTSIVHKGIEYKANIGAAIALECARAGAIVHLVSRSADKLEIVKHWIERQAQSAGVECSGVDLNNPTMLAEFVRSLPYSLPLYWVQSVGVGGGTVILKDDNPYKRIEDISQELLEAEMGVLRSTVTLLQLLLPRFRAQQETRICIISSMSAVRSVISGSMHNAAKGAISRFANAAMLELYRERIYITDVRPGGVDTGLYDSEAVRQTIIEIGANYGVDWSNAAGGPRLMPPLAVGGIVAEILSSEAHVTSVNMVSRGQFPHEGS